MINYSVYSKLSSKMATSKLQRLSKRYESFFLLKLYSLYLCVPICLLSLWCLNQMDEMKLYAVFPVAFALGIFISTVLFRTRDLGMPLWMGRNLMKWSGASLFIILLVGYLQL